MSEIPANGSMDSSTRKLTNLVWMLVVLVALNLFATIILGLAPSLLTAKLNREMASHARNSPDDPNNDFSEFPLARKIEAASVILRTEYQRINGREKCVISEILKQDPGIRFYYKVGDEYPELGELREHSDQNELGQIAFFLGNPASMQYATSYSSSRTGSLGNITIDELRKLISEHPSKRS